MKKVGFFNPQTISETLEVLASCNAKIVAGGTDIIPTIKLNEADYPANFVSIGRITSLRGISWEKGRIRIGSTTTYSDIVASETVKKYAPNLWQASYRMGNPAIRNAGTIGGNIANASPAADAVVALLAANAVIKVVSKVSERFLELKDVFVEAGKTSLKPDELITEIIVPCNRESNVNIFRRVTPRKGSSTALVNMALEGSQDGKKVNEIRIAFGAVAPTPIRAYSAEKELKGKELSEETIMNAVESISNDIAPIDDGRASAWYRERVCKNVLKEILASL